MQGAAVFTRGEGPRMGLASLWPSLMHERGDKVMDTSTIARSTMLFAVAGICEIAGGYFVWLWLRDHRTIWLGLLGGLVLFLYGVLPTLQPESASFGRVYATYGGVFIMLSLHWGWWVDGVRPDRFDVIGGLVALAGVAIIMYAPRA